MKVGRGSIFCVGWDDKSPQIVEVPPDVELDEVIKAIGLLQRLEVLPVNQSGFLLIPWKARVERAKEGS